ncbi:MAG: DUF4760 domain-containing protein [Stenotrophomonas rhizophila]|uniref:DUF4760 domain-containing protein n=1 Tax=Stenotrophomonas rhizophila TaxID=216778 RepID=UPI003D0DCA8E
MDWLWDLLAHEAFRGAVILLGVVVAIVSVLTARSTARKKQAADMLFASRGDQGLQEGCRTVKSLHEAPGKNLRTLLGDEEHKKEISQIMYVLNHFETVCVGIKNGIYDEAMIKDAWCSMMLNTYDYSLPVVEAVRQKHGKNTLFQEYEHLVVRWKKNPIATRKAW